MAKLLVDMKPMVLSKDNVHICSSNSHELSCGYLIYLSMMAYMVGIKTLMLHDIIPAKMGATHTITKVLVRLVYPTSLGAS